LFLGQIPNPKTGEGEVNLELAKMFIDQLAMIQEKTRGNLTKEESTVLRNAVSNLQMAFVEVARTQGGAGAAAAAPEPGAPEASGPPADEPSPADQPSSSASDPDSKKKFTKSYGA
jgi:hypothetical protein